MLALSENEFVNQRTQYINKLLRFYDSAGLYELVLKSYTF